MRFKGTLKIVSAVLILCFMFSTVFVGNSVYGASNAQLRDRRAKIQQEIAKANQEIAKLGEKKKETEEYVSALEKKIELKQDEISLLQRQADKLQQSIASIEGEIGDTEKKIKDTQAQIDKKQKEFDKTFEEYCQRLKAIYVSGSASNLEVLLTCPDISSILTRSQMIKSVSEKDSKALNDLMNRMSEIETAKAELEASINKLAADKKELEADKKELQANINSVAAAKAELDKEADEANALVSKLKGQQHEYYEKINTNKSEIDKIEREIQANIIAAQRKAEQERQQQGGGSSTPQFGTGGGNGKFRYPTDYRGISSGFYRRSGAYHGAIDFPCPTGSNVYAGADGTVITATWHYSYGNYVAIDHGGGFSTLYAHNSSLLVHVGQHVSRGQVIAKSGSTGNSTGPHCHFEVRINGARVNPLNYL